MHHKRPRFSANAGRRQRPGMLSSKCGFATLIDPWGRECRRHFLGVLGGGSSAAFEHAVQEHDDERRERFALALVEMLAARHDDLL